MGTMQVFRTRICYVMLIVPSRDLRFRTQFHCNLERPTFLLRYVLFIQRCRTTLRLSACLLALLDVSTM